MNKFALLISKTGFVSRPIHYVTADNDSRS